MALKIEPLPYKSEELSSNPQVPMLKLDVLSQEPAM